MFKIIHNMTACYCTNPITEVAECQRDKNIF